MNNGGNVRTGLPFKYLSNTGYVNPFSSLNEGKYEFCSLSTSGFLPDPYMGDYLASQGRFNNYLSDETKKVRERTRTSFDALDARARGLKNRTDTARGIASSIFKQARRANELNGSTSLDPSIVNYTRNGADQKARELAEIQRTSREAAARRDKRRAANNDRIRARYGFVAGENAGAGMANLPTNLFAGQSAAPATQRNDGGSSFAMYSPIGGLNSNDSQQRYQNELQKTLAGRNDRRNRLSQFYSQRGGTFGRNRLSVGDYSRMARDQYMQMVQQQRANYFGRGYFANGGSVFKPRGSDTVPAMLTPGEFVVNKNAAKKFAPQLQSMNTQYRADGGFINGAGAGSNMPDFSNFGKDLIKPLSDFNASAALLYKTFSELNGKITELANSLANITVKVEGRQQVDVILNGGSVLQGIMPEVRAVVNKAIAEALAQKFEYDKYNGNPT